MDRRGWGPALVGGLLLGEIVAATVYRDAMLTRGFAAVSPGMTQQDVVAILGRPWQTGDCKPGILGPADARCVEEYVYANPFVPILPKYPAIWFDASKRVVGKYMFISP